MNTNVFNSSNQHPIDLKLTYYHFLFIKKCRELFSGIFHSFNRVGSTAFDDLSNSHPEIEFLLYQCTCFFNQIILMIMKRQKADNLRLQISVSISERMKAHLQKLYDEDFAHEWTREVPNVSFDQLLSLDCSFAVHSGSKVISHFVCNTLLAYPGSSKSHS